MTTEYGDPAVARGNEILRTTVGSQVHGIAIEGTDDHDEMGIFIEPPTVVLGVGKPVDHYIWRTQPEGVRSGPGDTDLVMYSLRKYLRLAVKGNPTALLPLFAPEADVLNITGLGKELRALGTSLLSQEAGHRFLGYMAGQRERMMGGGKQNRVPNRPELVERYGYDTKYASHALRLAIQGLEVIQHGHLTLPLPEQDRLTVLEVKRGQHSKEVVLGMIRSRESTAHDYLMGRTPLPAHPDWETANRWSVDAHRRHWRTHVDWR